MKKGFGESRLDEAAKLELMEKARRARGDILRMTTLAGCGHPGGSMSSLEIYLMLFSLARTDPGDPSNPGRDRIVISHGHTSPGAYAALGQCGFIDGEKAAAGFRLAGSPFEGHVEKTVPGIEWNTGNLGQGLSAACGFALSARIHGRNSRVYCVMGDGEQQKGQISEARRFAVKYGLNNLVAIVDRNRLQISGNIAEVMPQDIIAGYRADGWEAVEIDGHDLDALYGALRQASHSSGPFAIVADTVMGKGVPFMENDEKWHGQALSEDRFEEAMTVLGLEPDLEKYKAMRAAMTFEGPHEPEAAYIKIDPGEARTYGAKESTDNRSAWGQALLDLTEANAGPGAPPIAVFDCDLAGSVKTAEFAKRNPDRFFQGGIQEHNTAVVAGAVSADGALAFFADFGVFGVDETYNQQRLNDINGTNLKLVCTHVGLDVGEDGKTHQCIDYVGALKNFFGFKVIVPADPNQTDRAVRHAAANPGNFFIGMGRSKLKTVLDSAGAPAFAGDYRFEYGKAERLRDGTDAAIVAMGCMTGRALEAADLLKERGVEAAVWNMSCPLDPDMEALKSCAAAGVVATLEDHNANTGLGASVGLALAELGLSVRLLRLGVSRYMSSGKPDDLFALAGLDPKSAAARIESAVREKALA